MNTPSVRAPKSPQQELAELEHRLPSSSPVRRWREQDDPSGEALVQALKACKRSDWISHAVAYVQLRSVALSPAERRSAIQLLTETLERPAPYGPESSSILFPLLTEFVLIAAKMIYPSLLQAWRAYHNRDWFGYEGLFYTDPRWWAPRVSVAGLTSAAVAVGSLPFVWGAATLFDRRRMNRLQSAAIETLHHIGDAGCIAALTHHVRQQTPHYEEALQALQAILPNVTPDWYGQLPSGTMVALTYLAESFDPRIALPALDALEQVGDTGSVLTVERLASQANSAEVRSRAAAVLPALHARRAQENAAATLLRAGSQPASEELVRPVYGGEPDVTNLLRASHTSASNPISQTSEA